MSWNPLGTLGEWIGDQLYDGGKRRKAVQDNREYRESERRKKEEFANRINANEQFILGRSMPLYINHYNSTHKAKYLPKSYTSIVSAGDVQMTRSHLFGLSGMDSFMTMSTDKLSALIPRVRFLQIVRNSGGSVISEQEFAFEDYQSKLPESITQDATMRGTGAGIKDISIDMEGDSIATAERQFKVGIKLYFSSLDEIFKKRSSAGGTYQYADLLKPSDMVRDPSSVASSSTRKLIKMEYGYFTPTDTTIQWTKGEKSAIQNARRVLTLGLYKQSVGYNENGSVVIDLEYHGYVEGKANKIDIFDLGLSPAARKELDRLENRISQINKKNPPTASPTTKQSQASKEEQDRAKKLNNKANDLRKRGYESFLKSIIYSKKMYSISHGKDAIGILIPQANNSSAPASNLSSAEVPAPNIRAWYEQNKKKKEGEEFQIINFFYLGDLLDEVLRVAEEKSDLKGFNYCVGSFMYQGLGFTKSTEIPISAVPISAQGFRDWFEENVLKKGERVSYSLTDFLKDIVNLALSAFSSAATGNLEGIAPAAPGIRTQVFNTKGAISRGEILGTSIPKGSLMNGLFAKNLTENYFIYGVNHFAEPPFPGTPSGDQSKGVYWLVAASESGITKKVTYSKNDTKFLTEARMNSNGFTKKGRVLWALYNAKIDMVGNPIFKPGMVVYVTSNAFSQRDADQLGLGGYFQVLKVRNSIAEGKFKTELETVWIKPSKGT